MTIISNNCCGVRLLQDLKSRYDTPTIALQIMPEEFTRFCKSLQHYMSQELTEYKDFSPVHKAYFDNMYHAAIDFPVGLLDDVAICFQHETDFKTAKEKWDRRKTRINYDKIYYVFCLDYPRYRVDAENFSAAGLDNAYIFTRDFDIAGKHYRYSVPENACFLDKDRPDHYYFEGKFNRGNLCN